VDRVGDGIGGAKSPTGLLHSHDDSSLLRHPIDARDVNYVAEISKSDSRHARNRTSR
jgi:hypothetical protein